MWTLHAVFAVVRDLYILMILCIVVFGFPNAYNLMQVFKQFVSVTL